MVCCLVARIQYSWCFKISYRNAVFTMKQFFYSETLFTNEAVQRTAVRPTVFQLTTRLWHMCFFINICLIIILIIVIGALDGISSEHLYSLFPFYYKPRMTCSSIPPQWTTPHHHPDTSLQNQFSPPSHTCLTLKSQKCHQVDIFSRQEVQACNRVFYEGVQSLQWEDPTSTTAMSTMAALRM